MPIFEIRENALAPVSETSFGAEGLFERRDIQRLLREHIDVLDDRLLVIAEEFGDWLDSSRRIDLLCVDGDANLVVVELKRSDDGGHMELQAIRYAAMVSTMTFDQAVDTLARHRNRTQPDNDAARTAMLSFFGWDSVDEDRFGGDTRIVLAAADFSKELTTAVMWLLEHQIDVRCVRLKPYKMRDGTVLLDIQQLIPLPEAASFQTQIGVKRQAVRREHAERHEERYRFWEGLLSLAKTRTPLHANRSPNEQGWIGGGIGKAGFSLTYALRRNEAQVELWFSFGSNQVDKAKQVFQTLLAKRTEIETIFGDELDWQELPDRDGCRIRKLIDGGYKSPTEDWPRIQNDMVEYMIRLDRAFRAPVSALKI